jgi:hypothetical protein
MSDDHSPGDRRQPYSDRGGPQARHAETHDVRRERHTNPKGPQPEDPSFAEQLAPVEAGEIGGHADESTSGVEVVQVEVDAPLLQPRPRLEDRQPEELVVVEVAQPAVQLFRLSILEPGTRLEQGGVYLDLNDLDAGPFKALGGHEATAETRYIAKRDTDYELWNRLAGRDDAPEIERPG